MVNPAPGMGLVELQKRAVDPDATALTAHVAFALSPFYGFLDIGGTEEAEEGPAGLPGKGLPKRGASNLGLWPWGDRVLSIHQRQGTSRKTVVGGCTFFRL